MQTTSRQLDLVCGEKSKFFRYMFSGTMCISDQQFIFFLFLPPTLWLQLEDMFQLIVTPQGFEKVMIQLKDTPSKVYAIGAKLLLSKVPLGMLQH